MSAPFNIGEAMRDAVAAHQQGRLRDAEKIYARVLKAAPAHFDALNLLGTIKAQQGHIGEAHRLFAAAVKANPAVPSALSNLGQALHALKRGSEALAALDKARALAPSDLSILYQHANVLLSLDRPSEALAEFHAVLAQMPQHPPQLAEAHINCGLAQAALGAPEQALAEFDAALTLVPGHPAAQYNRGVALLKLGRYEEAVAANDAALAVESGHVNAWLNRGKALAQLNRYGEAIASYGEVLAVKKDHADARFNQALALLTQGDYQRGFAAYEWRWRRTGMPPQKSRSKPLWLGEYPLQRKTVLVHAEQGLGDTIQFARYVPMLAASGAKVVLEVQPELQALMARLDGTPTVVARGEATGQQNLAFDVHCPLGSLPLALKTDPATVPAHIPYVTADGARLAKWSAEIGALPIPRIALAWSGNPSHDNDRNRSIALRRLAPLLENSPASFISIQRDLRDEDAQVLAASRITPIGDQLEDFADTAAVLALCDLVITVDTAAAHLAGAMGRPVFVLVPFAPDWRWTLTGDTTPWYPTARLFRQPKLDDWDSVIGRVAAELDRA